MVFVLQIITGLMLLAYPLAVYLGLNYLPVGTVAAIICGMLVLRLCLQRKQLRIMLLPVVAGIGLTAVSSVSQSDTLLLFYPVIINLTMLMLFSYSLISGPSMIERLARLKEPNLPDEAKSYLNKVTLIWCGLFSFNALAATYTALYTSIEVWTLYNGLISYILIGCLFASEFLYRTFWLKK